MRGDEQDSDGNPPICQPSFMKLASDNCGLDLFHPWGHQVISRFDISLPSVLQYPHLHISLVLYSCTFFQPCQQRLQCDPFSWILTNHIRHIPHFTTLPYQGRRSYALVFRQISLDIDVSGRIGYSDATPKRRTIPLTQSTNAT